MAQGKLAFGFQYRWQHDMSQRVQLRLVSKEAGLTNCDLVEQAHKFGLSNRFYRKAVVVFAKSADSQFLQASLAAVLQEMQFVVGLENTCNLIDEISNFDQTWIGWACGFRNLRHGAGYSRGHAI